MVSEAFRSFKATTWIEGQIRHRRKCYKALFFLNVQLTDSEEKVQVLFRYDDHSMTNIQHEECLRACKPGRVIRLLVGEPTNDKERENKGFQVWQSIDIPEVIKEYTDSHPFIPDPPLIQKTQDTIKKWNGEQKLKKDMLCKYWINQRTCVKMDTCPFQHPTGLEFEKAREYWIKERLERRKIVTNDPNDPHHDKNPHGLRAMYFSKWIYNDFLPKIISTTTALSSSIDYSNLLILDIAGGKGEVSLFLSRGYGIPTTVVEPNVRKQPKYWLTRRQLFMHKHGFFKDRNNRNENDDSNEKKENKIENNDQLEIDENEKDDPSEMNENEIENEDENEEEKKIRFEKAWPYPNCAPNFIPTLLDDHFIEQYKDLLSNITLMIGLHPDEATEPICDAALKLGIPFAVVPCCVFSHHNRHRKLSSGELVSTTKDLIQYIREKDTSQFGGKIVTDYLPFEGKNEVVYWIPEDTKNIKV